MKKTMKCNSCKKQIPKNSRVCPYCGATQHKLALTMCSIIVIVTAFLIVGILYSGDDNSQPVSEDQSNFSSASPSEAEESKSLIYNKDGLEISFLGFEAAPKPAIGYYINLSIDNKSDSDLTIQVTDVSADGIEVPFENAIFSGEVSSGKTLNDHIWITNTEQLGIDEIMSSVDLKFVIYSGNDFSDGQETETITIK